MTKKVRRVVVMAAAILAFAATGRVLAAVYRYVDDKGVECYTDSIYTVPDRFRDKAVLVNEDGTVVKRQSREDTSSSGITQRQEDLSDHDKEEFAGVDWVGRWRKILDSSVNARTVVCIAGFCVVFAIAGKAGTALGRKQISSVIRFALTVALLTYLTTVYMKNMASFYVELKENVLSIKKQADDRNAQLQKASDALFGEPKK